MSCICILCSLLNIRFNVVWHASTCPASQSEAKTQRKGTHYRGEAIFDSLHQCHCRTKQKLVCIVFFQAFYLNSQIRSHTRNRTTGLNGFGSLGILWHHHISKQTWRSFLKWATCPHEIIGTQPTKTPSSMASYHRFFFKQTTLAIVQHIIGRKYALREKLMH